MNALKGRQIVVTKSACARCTTTVEREGAQGVPPPKWSRVEVTVAGEGPGWQNSTHAYDEMLCPACTKRALVFLRKPADGATGDGGE